ncbi:MAG: glycosyltransferase [Methanoregula sp.]|jgi:glycosyltransferase involved in cell wall biosynthesis
MSPDHKGPEVSIILPACNSADGLPATIESVLNQTYPYFELIVVDDGSTDTTPEILAGLEDPRVIIIRHPEQQGMARACNTGISATRGELVGFISSSDEWEAGKLEEQVAVFSRLPPEYGVVYTDVWEMTPAGNRAYWHTPGMDGPDLLNSYATDFQAGTLGTGPILVRRSYLDEAGPFDEQLRCFSDTDMLIRLQRVCRFHHIEKPLCFCRSRQAHTGTPFDRSIALLLLLQKYPETLKNPVFLTQQLDRIRRNLQQAPESRPEAPGRVAQEPEQGHFREPVSEL